MSWKVGQLSPLYSYTVQEFSLSVDFYPGQNSDRRICLSLTYLNHGEEAPLIHYFESWQEFCPGSSSFIDKDDSFPFEEVKAFALLLDKKISTIRVQYGDIEFGNAMFSFLKHLYGITRGQSDKFNFRGADKVKDIIRSSRLEIVRKTLTCVSIIFVSM